MKPAIGEAVPESFFSVATPAVGEEVSESFFESSKPAIGEAVPDSFFESSVPSAQMDAGQRDNAVSKEATVPPTGLLHTAKSFLARPIPGERAVAQAAQNTVDWFRGIAPENDAFGTLDTPAHEQSIPQAALQALGRGLIARPVQAAMDSREAYATNPDSSFIGRNVAEAAIQGEGRAFSVIERLGGYQTPDEKSYADLRNAAMQEREQRAAALDTETGSSQFWGQAIRGAGASLITSAGGAMVGGPAGAIGAAISTTGNMAVTEGIEAGLDGEELRNYVARQMAAEGIPSAAFQMVGLGGLEKILGGLQLRRLGKEGAQSAKRGVVEALKGLGWNVAEEIPEELIVETLQTLNDHYSGVQDVRELTPEQIRHHVMQTVAQTVLAVGAASTPNIAKGTGESLVDARQRRRDAQASTATPVEPADQPVLAEPQRPPAEPAEDPASAPPEPSEDVETVSPTQVPTETEIVQQRPAEAVEEDADQGRGEDTGESLLPPSSHPVMELPVAILQLSEDVPNFKEGSDESGVVEGQQLDGTFERLGTAPIVVWERSNGRLEVITGRHRLDLARRSGENSIPAQVVREQDGFSQQHALTFDAESNIRDGQGSVRDYAHYFRNAEISEEEAGQRGLLSRVKGQDGWYLGHHATNDLYDAFRNRSIAERGAVAIVRAAPGNEAGQRVGLRYSQANPKASAQEIGNAVRSAVAMAGHVEGTQTDLFGNVTDDAFLAEMERRGKIASDQQRLVAEQIRILNAAKIDPAKARELGIDIKIGDRAGIEAERTRLRQLQERWREWHLDPELRAIVMEEEGARGVQETLPEQIGEQQTGTTGDLFGASQEPTGQQIIDTSKQTPSQPQQVRNPEQRPDQSPDAGNMVHSQGRDATSARSLEIGPLTQYSNRPDGWVAGDGQPIASGQPVRLRGFRGTGRTESDDIYGPGIDTPIFGNATYLAHSKRDAEIYGPDVSESDVILQNPLVLTNSEQLSELMDNRPVPMNAADMVPFMQELTKRVKGRGHDGVIVNLSDADVDHAGASNKHLQRLFGHSQAVVFPKARPSRSSGHADAAPPQLTLPDIPRPAGDVARTVAESPGPRRPRNEALDPTVAERPDLVDEWRGRLFGPNRGPRVEVLDADNLDITVEEALRYTDDPVLQAAAREAQERGDSVIVTPPGYDKQAEYDPATRTVRVTRNATGAEVAHEFLHGVLEHTGPLNRAEQQALKRGVRDRQGRNWNELDAAGRRGFTEEVIRQGIAYFEQHSAAPQGKMERALWKIGQWVKSVLDGLGLRNLTPEDVFDRLYRGYGQERRGNIWGPGRSPFEGGDGRQASVRAGLTAREELGRQVAMDAYVGGKLRTESPVIFSYAPSWMRMLGHGDHQTFISQRGMQKITTDKHWLNKRVIEKLPAAIADPLEVLLHDERYVVITDLDGERGSKVAVIIEPDALNQNQPFHIIKSVYPAGEGQIAAWRRHKDYRIVYRKEETPTVTGGVQFAKVAAKGSLEDSSIATSRDLDKWEAENLSAEERQTVRTGARLEFDPATRKVTEMPDTRASIRRPGEDGAGRSRDENPKQELDLYPPSGEPTPGDRTQAAVVQLPELVRLARGLMDGRYPRVMKRIGVMGGNALGVFRGEPGNPRMELRADIFVGPLLATQRSRRRLSDEAIEEFRQKVLSELDIPEDKLVIRQERHQGFNVVNVYLEDPGYASRTLAHEIGHLVDFLPDHDLGRGNVLGRIATLKRHLRQSISSKPDGEKALSPKDRRELRRRARAKASQELKFATKEEIAEATKEFYYDYLIEELERRDLIVENTITSPSGAEFPGVRDELKNLTHWWKPFEAIPGDSYTDYRYSSVELYADALSVMLNHPVAFREKAPIFAAAFDAYLKRKPQVKQLYEEIQQEIHGARETETRLNDIYAMFDRGDEERRRIREKKKKAWSVRGFLKELERFFIESRAHIPKTSDPDMDPRVWTSELMYLSSTATQFFRDVNGRILQELEQHSLDQKHLAAFLFLRRAETERRLMANPLGLQGEFATETMQAMQQELGAERFAVLEGLADRYRELREDYVFPLLRETRLLSEDLLEHIENNENYATFNVIEYLDKAFGGPGSGAAIYRQLGTLQEIESPFIAMMMKDISLIRAAVRNQAKRATVSKLSDVGEAEPATRRWDGKKLAFVEPKNPDQSLMVYSEDGQLRGVYIDKAVAEWFDADPVRAGLVGRALDTLNRPYRAAWITYAPWFGFWNFQRDWRAMWMHLPENPVTLTPKLLWNTVVATRHAFLDAFFDHSTPLVRDMYRMNVLVPDMNYRAQEWEGHDTELERTLSTYDVSPGQPERLSKKVALAIPRLVRNWNATLERITKVAGYRYLLRNGYFEREGMQARERVRSMIGTPNALTGGTARIWLNRIFLFSNINIQGWRAASMAIRERPGTYLLKIAMADILPKVAMFAAASGLLRVIRDMSGGSGGDGDEEDDELKAIMDRIPAWDKESYTVIPLGLTEDDQAVYMLFPHDHVGQFAGSMTWVALQQLEGAVPSEFGRIVERHVPIGPGNLNPGLRLTMDVANYMYGRNPHDEFWGGEKISTDAFTAGGMTGLRELLQNEWDASFGGFYRFKARNQKEAENELEAVLNLPGIGNVFRRFVRVSRRGLDDQLQRDISLAEKDVAAQVIQMKDIIRESLSQEERGRKAPTPALMREAWQRAREAGAVPEGYERQYFDMRYKRAWIWRYGTDEERLSLQTTSSVRERLNRP